MAHDGQHPEYERDAARLAFLAIRGTMEDNGQDGVTTMEQTLTALDRCDRCRAPARAKTMHKAGPLLWCAHHFHVFEEALTPNLVVYLTETPDEASKEPAKR